MKIKLPAISLALSSLCLIGAITTVIIGSSKSRIYNQMRKAERVSTIAKIKTMNNNPFLLSGRIKIFHPTIADNLVAYNTISYEGEIIEKRPELTISLEDGDIALLSGYDLNEYNREICYHGTSHQGIKSGSDITIYAIVDKMTPTIAIRGHELYPGSPDQYINYLSSPYNAYMIYVRAFIAIALIFFIFSTVLNRKK